MRAISGSRVLFFALCFSFLCVAAPAATASFDAKNAKKVDGLKAVKSTTVAKKRKNKLVATDKTGQLPNNIVALVAEATHAQTSDQANHATNADQLAGEVPGAFQQRVN